MHFFQRQGDILQSGQMGEEIEGLEHGANGSPVSHQFLLPIDDFTIVQKKGATIRCLQARNDAQKRRLAAAGRTNQGEGVHLIEVEIDILQHDLATEGLGQIWSL